MTLESGRLQSTWTFHCCSCLCLPTSQFLFNSEVGHARPVKWLSSPHGPTRGLMGPITSKFSWNLLSKLARMCSGYERGSHPLPHGCDGSSKAPRELGCPPQPSPRAFRGAEAGSFPHAALLVHEKKKNDPTVQRFVSKTALRLKPTVVADWWEEAGKMTPRKKSDICVY